MENKTLEKLHVYEKHTTVKLKRFNLSKYIIIFHVENVESMDDFLIFSWKENWV